MGFRPTVAEYEICRSLSVLGFQLTGKPIDWANHVQETRLINTSPFPAWGRGEITCKQMVLSRIIRCISHSFSSYSMCLTREKRKTKDDPHALQVFISAYEKIKISPTQ